MPSYLAPQVDHNLYQPAMPQTNVAEIFQLMGLKQSMYDSNLAKINTQASSMNDLESKVSSSFVKEKVNTFNTKANEKLKSYTNLDFSIRDNVNIINNLYDPLLKDQDFLIDYSATSHGNNEMQKALSMRDSTDKDRRSGYSDNNLMYILNGTNLLKTAKNTKELKMAAAEATSRYYSPYTDVGDETLKKIKELGATVEWDDVTNGYIVTREGSAADPGFKKNIKDFLELTLSDNAKNQIKINSTLKIDNLIQQRGIDQVALDYLKEIPTQVKYNKEIINDEMEDIESKISLLPKDPTKRTSQQKAYYQTLLEKKGYLDKLSDMNTEKEKTYSRLQEQLQNGTYNSNDIIHLLRNEMQEADIQAFTENFSNIYSSTHSKLKVDSSSYNTQKTVALGYANLAHDKLKHRDAQNQLAFTNALALETNEREKQKLILEAKKEGLTISSDANGNPVFIPESNKTIKDHVYDIKGVDNINQKLKELQNIRFQKNDESEAAVEHFKNILKKSYPKGISDKRLNEHINNFKRGNLNNYNSEIRELYQYSPFNNVEAEAEESWLKANIKEAAEKFNKQKGYEAVKINPTTGEVEIQEKEVGMLETFTEGVKGGLTSIALLFSGAASLKESTELYTKSSDNLKNSTKSEFENFLVKSNKEGGYGLGIDIHYEGRTYPAGKQGNAFIKENLGTTLNYTEGLLQEGDNTLGTLKSLNPDFQGKNAKETLEKFNQLIRSENVTSMPSVDLDMKSTKVSFPNLKLEDLYSKEELGDEPTEEQLEVYNNLKKGLNLNIPHGKNPKLDLKKASVSAKKTVYYKDLSAYENFKGELIVSSKEPNYLYNPEEGVKVEKNKDGHFEILPRTGEVIKFNNQDPESKNLSYTLNNLYYNLSVYRDHYDNDDFKTKLNNVITEEFLKNNKIPMNADGTFTIPLNVIEKI